MFSLAKIMKPVLGLLAGLTMLSAAAGFAAAQETRVVFVTHGQSGDPYLVRRQEWHGRCGQDAGCES